MNLLTVDVSRTIDQIVKELGITSRMIYRYIDYIRATSFVVNNLYGNVFVMGKVDGGIVRPQKTICFTCP